MHDTSILFMGDSTIKTEYLLLNNSEFKSIVNDADYYQVGNHGSKT